jgi:hypothetical protein
MGTVDGSAEVISLGAYARHRNVSVEAVSKAVRKGKLSKSVRIVDGRPKLVSIEAADAEWATTTRPRFPAPTPAPPCLPSESALVGRRGDRVALAFMESKAPRTDHGIQAGAFLDGAQLETSTSPIDESDYSLESPLQLFTMMDRSTARALAAALLAKANE